MTAWNLRDSPSTLSGFGLSAADSSVCEWKGGEGVISIVYVFFSVTTEKDSLTLDFNRETLGTLVCSPDGG